jgi:hypothetical protein
MPELTQFDNGKSIILNLPPKGAAGFARFAVKSPSLEPRPPAMITAIVLRVRLLTNRPDRRGCIKAPVADLEVLTEAQRAKPVCYIRGTIIHLQDRFRARPGTSFEDYRSLPADAQTVYPRVMPTPFV